MIVSTNKQYPHIGIEEDGHLRCTIDGVRGPLWVNDDLFLAQHAHCQAHEEALIINGTDLIIESSKVLPFRRES